MLAAIRAHLGQKTRRIRVLLPLWVVVGHNALYISVEFVWLFFDDDW